jgi:hypothetical protein
MPDIPTPFSLDDADAYARWRDARLALAPRSVDDLVVEVGDSAALTAAERGKIAACLARANMAVYAERPDPGRDHKAALRALGRQLGLISLDANHLADDDGITPLMVHKDGTRARYIPYMERPITWHTDGYYNTPERTVRALLLHCVAPAAQGGANRLMDHELAYIRLRDRDPDLIRLLSAPDALTIPGNDEEGMQRPATVGPVFSVDDGGHLHMRYTARTRNVEWSASARPAAQALLDILDGPDAFSHVLQPGQGLISNNVAHTREPFTDDPASPRLLYRARYHQRIHIEAQP